ncbi:uncharacterized protein LOC124653037 isoform X2 [Lolium rigidum]|uniref:uncharacterized protein LOC124653037 isoform X2 n=1 Tax=Lolium rigidum TaxID=89674 RepID=UPI001F5C22FF|nr:uncharacterized protein LOC124653037 isoform X2 [Lolium rigidum]
MDLNLYLGLPPLPRPPGRLGAAMDCPPPAPEAPRRDDEPAAGSPAPGSPAPEEMPPPPPLPAAYSPPSNALSTPEMPPIDPILVDWLDGPSTDDSEDYAGDPAVPTDLSSDDDGLGTGSEDALGAAQPAALPSYDASSSDDDGLSTDSEYYVLLPDLVIPEISTEDDEPAGLLAAQEEMLPLDEVDSPDAAGSWGVDFPMIFAQSDGLSADSEEALGSPAVGFDASSHDANASPPPPQQLPLAGLEGVRLEWVERLSRPDRAARAEMVSTRQSVGGAIEDTTHELRLQRVIQVSEQHHIVRAGPASRNQRATSPDAERLAQAIQRSHNSLDASRRQNLDANGKMGGKGAVKNDGNYCGCDASFECNICLDAAKEPVVTPCGHLFCWPCLYQWLHAHSTHSECPVCKGEVLEVNVTPIYGRGGGERDASSSDVPPRPSANRSESLRQELQMPDPGGIATMVRQLIENPDQLGGQAAPPVGDVEVAVFSEGGTRVATTVRRRASPSLASPSPLTMRHVRRNAAPESGNPVELPSSNSDNAATTVPQQSSSVEQASTSSTVAVIVGQAAQSRRSRPPSESTTTRRMRRRQQH